MKLACQPPPRGHRGLRPRAPTSTLCQAPRATGPATSPGSEPWPDSGPRAGLPSGTRGPHAARFASLGADNSLAVQDRAHLPLPCGTRLTPWCPLCPRAHRDSVAAAAEAAVCGSSCRTATTPWEVAPVPAPVLCVRTVSGGGGQHRTATLTAALALMAEGSASPGPTRDPRHPGLLSLHPLGVWALEAAAACW